MADTLLPLPLLQVPMLLILMGVFFLLINANVPLDLVSESCTRVKVGHGNLFPHKGKLRRGREPKRTFHDFHMNLQASKL